MEIKNEYLNLSGAQAWEIVVNYEKQTIHSNQ